MLSPSSTSRMTRSTRLLSIRAVCVLVFWRRDREQDAFEDIAALGYVSGPMYERHVDNAGREITVPLGDLKFGRKVWKGRNRTLTAARLHRHPS